MSSYGVWASPDAGQPATRGGSRPSSGSSQPPKRPRRRPGPAPEAPGSRGARPDPHGYDAGQKIKRKKRHVLVDTQGLLPHAIVTAADIQDRDGRAWMLGTLFGRYPFLLKPYADGGYQGPEFRNPAALGSTGWR
jgi:hypothetical protein